MTTETALCRGSKVLRSLISLSFALVSTALGPMAVTAAETISVPPAGVATWSEMLAHGVHERAMSAPERRVVPLMPGPSPREIGPLSESVTPSAPSIPHALAETTAPLSPLTLGFQALPDDNTSIPPDTMGAVGPNHLMTMLNTQVRIQDKSGTILGTVSLATFWTVGTGLAGDPFDPHVVYDSLSGRWIATVDADANLPTSQVWFAISATDDPTAAWTFYSFAADPAYPAGTTWADFPGFGVNNCLIAITDNMFTVGPAPAFVAAKMWVINKQSALDGGELTVRVFPPGFDLYGGVSGFTLQPAVTFDPGAPLYVIDNSGYSWGGVFALRLSVIIGGCGQSMSWYVLYTGWPPGNGLLLVANNFTYTQIGAPQLGVTATCDGGTNNGLPCTSDADCPPGLPTSSCRLVKTNDPRVLNAVFRNGRLWATHSAGLPAGGAANRTAVFWYQLNPGASLIVQSGVLDGGTSVHHFFPSIAVNAVNDAAIGFSRSDASRYIEGVYTGRLAGDPPGTMDPISVLKTGEDSYLKDFGSKRIRWGDYSATVVDPADDLTFWTLQEYAASDVGPAADDDRWGTWWGRFGGPVPTPTGPTPNATLTPTVSPTPTPAPLDHFTCYKAGASKGSVKFPGIPIPPGIMLTDQWGSSMLEVKKPKFLCPPTDKNGENPGADTHPEHLKAYQLKLPHMVLPVSRTNLTIVDQFNPGGLLINAKKQSYLLVPTVKSLTGPTPVPTPPAFSVDHFECYKALPVKGAPKFVPVLALPLHDQFGTLTVDVKKPMYLCNPTDKNGEDPTAPAHVDHLMCYQVKQVDPVPFVKRVGIFVNNQFGPETLDVKKPALLCVPALKNP